jgi:serine/threonine-protein phosphatase 2A regulatory subunit A
VAKCKSLVPRSGRSPEEEKAEDRVIVAQRLVKRVTSLTEDDSEHVRAALAMVATELAPILGKDDTISYLVPPVLLLLRDAASEVRLNLISSLGALNEVIGVDLLSQSLLPAILDLAQDGKWRIRLAIIHHIPLLAKQLGKDFFSEKLASLCVAWLGDDISSIRQAAAANLKDLAALFGTEWATEYLIPSIKEISQHQSYLRRLTAVRACALMSTTMESETVKMELLPLVLEMSTDMVRTFCLVVWLPHFGRTYAALVSFCRFPTFDLTLPRAWK